jgi:hypothetical protein
MAIYAEIIHKDALTLIRNYDIPSSYLGRVHKILEKTAVDYQGQSISDFSEDRLNRLRYRPSFRFTTSCPEKRSG